MGPSIASQLVIQGNTESRLTHLNNIVPSCNSQLVLFGNRNSSQGFMTQTVLKPTVQNAFLKTPQSNSKNDKNMFNSLNMTTKTKTQTVAPTNIVRSKISFSQCVQLLHYCRLVHKCIVTGSKIHSCARVADYLSSWLLGLV